MTDHTDGETIQSSWAYDKNDRALYVMQDGKIMGFGYNGVGEMTSIRYSAGNTMEIEGAVRTVTYEYDDLGRLTAVKSGEVDTSNETMAENVKTVKDYSIPTMLPCCFPPVKSLPLYLMQRRPFPFTRLHCKKEKSALR